MLRGKEYIEFLEREEQSRKNRAVLEQKAYENQNKEYFEANSEIQAIKEEAIANLGRKHKFSHDLKKTLLFECLNLLLNKSIGTCLEENSYELIKRNLITNFIEENTVEGVLGSFKGKTYVLSEFYRVINNYYDIISEACKSKNEDTLDIDPETKDNFYVDIDTKDVDDLASAIKTRVTTAVNEFIDQNTKDQLEIKDIIQQTQDKVNSLPSNTDDAVKESYEAMSKQKIGKVRSSRPRNVLECMVTSIATNVMKNETLQESYMVNGKLDMDKIVESTTIMYTFLEMLNSAKIERIDEDYIQSTLDNLGK